MVRAHVLLPEDVLQEVDMVAGKRKRSRFVEEAVREKLSRVARALALEETAGAIDLADYPEWETGEKISAWVKASRREDDQRLSRKVGPVDR